MSLRVLFFGRPADAFGPQREVALDAPSSVGAVRARLAVEDAVLLAPGVRASVDRVIVGDDAQVSPGQELAFFSVFSGG
jgi:molybdopterin synthase sulfur carrier subunit